MDEKDWSAIHAKDRVTRKYDRLRRVMNECDLIVSEYVHLNHKDECWQCVDCMERSTMAHDAMRHHPECAVGIAQDTYHRVRRYLVREQ